MYMSSLYMNVNDIAVYHGQKHYTSHQKIQFQCKSLEPQYFPKTFKILRCSDTIIPVLGFTIKSELKNRKLDI